MTNKVFKIELSPYHNKYIISINHNNFRLGPTKGSYNIIMARLFNMSYATFLRMCRDVYGAELIGKKSMYPVPYFTESAKAMEVARLLNKRAEYVLSQINKGEVK